MTQFWKMKCDRKEVGEPLENNFPLKKRKYFLPHPSFLSGMLGCQDMMLGTATAIVGP